MSELEANEDIRSAEARTHELKTWPEYFEAIRSGRKRFELRRNDRHFGEGDMLWLREYHPVTGTYTGRELQADITYVLRDPVFGLLSGYVILSLSDVRERGE